jgi:hypothetical protein
MKQGSLADFLVRTVLDEAFRELALTDPERAFQGFDLSHEQKEILRRRDHRLLGLLGDAVAPTETCPEPPVKQKHGEPVAAAAPSLPEVKLLLRLVPQVTQSRDSDPNISYAASLHPYPGEIEQTTDPDTTEQPQQAAGCALDELRWIIRFVPTILGSGDAGTTVAYAASIHPWTSETDPIGSQIGEPGPALASPPWNHHVASSAAKDAARAVQAAAPSRRYEKLLELVHALQTGDHGN